MTAALQPPREHTLPAPDRTARWVLPALAFAFYLSTAQRYGYFRDELYYLACGEHLGLGYVDHPPLVGWIAAAVSATLGDSLVAIRILPAVAGAATVWLAAATARELGGGRFAQRLAAACTVFAGNYMFVFSVFTMNAFDVLFWAACTWIAARTLRTGEQRGWVTFGLVAGVGLENKISVLFLGFGVFLGLLASRRWDVLRSPWAWTGALLAGLLFLPHAVWQASHGWPMREFIENARRYKIAELSPDTFLGQQVLEAGPASFPVWIVGLCALLFGASSRQFRTLGWTYLAVLSLMMLTRSKPYYVAPAYTMLFAAGAVAWEGAGERARWLSVAVAVLAVLGGVLIAPFAKPILPPDEYARFASWIGVQPASGERQALGRMPQHFADMFGWRELAETVASVHRSLPPEERKRAFVFGQNYGEAAAIDRFGPELGLPKAISAHNSYFLWGPRDWTGEVLIVIGDDRESLLELFEEVELGATFDCTDCMPYEDEQPIWVCRRLKLPVAELWERIKRFI